MDKFDRQAREESRVVRAVGGWRAERVEITGEKWPPWRPIGGSGGTLKHAGQAVASWRKARARELRGLAAAPVFQALMAASTSPRKAAAVRENGRKGGRPRKPGPYDWAAQQARKESRITTRPPHYWLSVYAEGGDGTEGGWMSIGPYPTRRAVWPDLRAWREKRAAELRAEGDEDGR